MRPLCAALGFSSLLWPIPAHAATYYVAPAGDDANPGSEAAPFETLGKGASVLAPGDTLLVRAGSYAEEFYNGIPGGMSWAQAVTIAAYPGEKPVIKPAAGAARVFTFASNSVSYVVVEGLVLDATNTQYDAIKVTWGSATGPSNHIRIKSCEVFGSPGQGILITGQDGKNGLDVTGNEFIDLDVHDNGTTDFDHGFYVSTAGNLIEGCRVHANAGWGIHVYNGSNDDADGNVIRNNRSYDNAAAGNRGVGIGIYSGSGTIAYNNLVWGNKTGIALDYGASGAGVFNNVVYGNSEGGVSVGQDSNAAQVKNNAVWKNGTGVTDAGTGTVLDKNLVDVDPLFVDATNHDFHPTAASPLVDQGVTIAEVTADIDGVPRPQGSAYDIGAYELCPSGPCGAGGAGGSAGGNAGGAGGGAGAAGGTPGGGAAGSAASGGQPTVGGALGNGGSVGTGGSKAGAGDEEGGCGCRASSSLALPWLFIVAALGALSIARRLSRPRRSTRRDR